MDSRNKVSLTLCITFACVSLIEIIAGIVLYSFLKEAIVGSIILVCIGIVFLTVAAVIYMLYAKDVSLAKRLIEDANYVYAYITDVKLNYYISYTINHVQTHPYVIFCEYIDDYGTKYKFKSKFLFINPIGLIKTDKIKVYVDNDNYKKYYVDTQDIFLR